MQLKTVEVCDVREPGDGPNRRKLLKLKWKNPPPICLSRNISDEFKRLLLKWYIGKLPIPRRGIRIPGETARARALRLDKSEP